MSTASHEILLLAAAIPTLEDALRIVHISTYDRIGGAAIAAFRLHSALRQLGQHSVIFVREQATSDSDVLRFRASANLPNRIKRRWRRHKINRSFDRYKRHRPSGYELFSDDRSEHQSELIDQLPPCDIVNVHWTSRFLDFQTFFEQIPQKVPVIWTLHDMNAFTGGCHYDHGCNRYRNHCGCCPQLGSETSNDLSRQIWRRKAKTLARIPRARMHLVTPSQWLAEVVKDQTMLSDVPLTTIYNGVDLAVFAPRDRCLARDLLGLPKSSSIVLFAADSMSNQRKGFSLLRQALNELTDIESLLLLSVGDGKPQLDTPIPHVHLGRVNDERLLSVVYSAADTLVVPSLQENLALTAIESMACGTPVITFNVGGFPECVLPDRTGLLAKSVNVSELSLAIRRMLVNSTARRTMSIECRRLVEKQFGLAQQACRYMSLYESVLTPIQ